MEKTIEWVEKVPMKFPHGVTMRLFQSDAGDGHLTVMVGREPMPRGLLWHLSMSFRSNSVLNEHGGPAAGSRLPTWEEIKDARYRFCPDKVYMAMILPPMAEYVNVHPTTMHLHEIPGEN